MGSAAALGAATITVVATSIGVLIVPRPPRFSGLTPQGRMSSLAYLLRRTAHCGEKQRCLLHVPAVFPANPGATPVGNSKRLRETYQWRADGVCDGRHTTHLNMCVRETAELTIRRVIPLIHRDTLRRRPIIGPSPVSPSLRVQRAAYPAIARYPASATGNGSSARAKMPRLYAIVNP